MQLLKHYFRILKTDDLLKKLKQFYYTMISKKWNGEKQKLL